MNDIDAKRLIHFTVYGSPIAQPRIRARGFLKDGEVFAHIYEPGKKDSPARQWKSDIKSAAEKLKPSRPSAGPVGVWIHFFFPRPKRLMRKKDPDGALPHISKPDRDNCEKAVLDALKGLFFVDDSQVCRGEVTKWYHEKHTGPRADITIEYDND